MAEVIRKVGVVTPGTWCWQRRVEEAGVEGLLREKKRRPGKASWPDVVVVRLIARLLGDPSGEAAGWSGGATANVTDLALSTMQRIRRPYGPPPRRLEISKRSRYGLGLSRQSPRCDRPLRRPCARRHALGSTRRAYPSPLFNSGVGFGPHHR